MSFTNGQDYPMTESSWRSLSLSQNLRKGTEVKNERRIDFINRQFMNGNCSAGIQTDKNGKLHYVTTGNYMGEECFKYAMHLLSGGNMFKPENQELSKLPEMD